MYKSTYKSIKIFASNPENYEMARKSGMTYFYEVENPVLPIREQLYQIPGNYVLASTKQINDRDAKPILSHLFEDILKQII